MKKTLSVFLAILMIFMCTVPAFAAEGDVTDGTENTKTYTVKFRQPTNAFKDGYMFVKSVNGEIQYEEDPNGIYVFYDNRYMTMDNIYPSFQDGVPPERYSPVQLGEEIVVEEDGTFACMEVAEGETLTFRVMTSKKYNVYTAAVFINNERAYLNPMDEYSVYVDRDLKIHVAEYDNNGNEALLRSHYNVKLTSGEGYKVKTLKDQNYGVVYYGDSFDFRVQIASGFVASGMTVSVQRGNNDLSSIFGEDEDLGAIGNLFAQNEELICKGIDEDGCRIYTIENITDDCKIIIDGVQEESSVGIMSFFKRIIRLIANLLSGLLGIDLGFLDSITAYYNVSIDASQADGITYEVIRSNSDELSPSEFTVTSGEGITIVVTKKSLNDTVNVMWTPGNESGSYTTPWILDYNTITGEVSYSAVYNIDNITADTEIVIY